MTLGSRLSRCEQDSQWQIVQHQGDRDDFHPPGNQAEGFSDLGR